VGFWYRTTDWREHFRFDVNVIGYGKGVLKVLARQ
jgi:hypothetical protein